MALVSYVGEPWNTDLDNRLRDKLLDEEFEDFDLLWRRKTQSWQGMLCGIISGEQFGFSTVSNLLVSYHGLTGV